MCNNIYMKNVGILGGTFNPVHLEHVNMAINAIKELKLDKLLIVPSKIPPHKNTIPLPGKERLKMLELAFSNVEKVEICDWEIRQGGKSYSYLTVEHFSNVYKSANLYFIVGGDMLNDFRTWKNPSRILELCDLAVFTREGYYTNYKQEKEYFIKNFNKPFIKLNYVGKNVSSTKIRVFSAFGLNLDGQSIKEVTEYIQKNNLYAQNNIVEFVKNNLTAKRLIHTANVTVLALTKARELKLDENKILTACILHDCAKYLNPKDFADFTLPIDVPSPVVHAFLGEHIARKVLKIEDEEVLDAIKYHTSGKANMSDLAKLVFVADMIEEGRDYEGVELLREEFEKDFENCFLLCLKEEMQHLINKKSNVYIETINAYDYYINKKRDEE